MSTPKLFEFPDGAVIDLNHVYGVSRPYLSDGEYQIEVFFVQTPDVAQKFFLGADRGKAFEEKRSLVNRWGADK